MQLPVARVLPAVARALRAGTSAVLEAPPGAGKTTLVPLALLDEPWLEDRRIVLLEPRRLAARAAATHMARLIGEDVGRRVGLRMRMDTRVSAGTRIEVVTEGVLTRMLQDDPSLDGTGLVIFDEFHERSVHADLGLALTLDARDVLRADLRVLVMSATIEGDRVAALLADAPVIRCEGRVHPVETRYLPAGAEERSTGEVVRAILRSLDHDEGDILVFLPGGAEIRRVEARLRKAAPPATTLHALHGSLPQDAQDRAISPARDGSRKVVLSTAIAETSLTIEGIRVVVDGGLMRVPSFSPRTGMTRLVTLPATRASADQRRGRAGRTAPGVCYRTWTESSNAGLVPFGAPEILQADLAPVALELAAWGVAVPERLRWLDLPPAGAWAQATELLRELGAIDSDGAITPHGRELARIGLHPRLAHMIVAAQPLGASGLACDIAALLGERDVLRGIDGIADPDIGIRLDLLRSLRTRGARLPREVHDATVDVGAVRRGAAVSDQLARGIGVRRTAKTAVDPGLLLAFAYPDRIGRRRGEAGRFLLRNGRGAAIDGASPLAVAEWIVAAEVGGHGRDSRVFLGASLTLEAILDHFGNDIIEERSVAWDAAAQAVRARHTRRLGALTVAEGAVHDAEPDAILSALVEGVRAEGLRLLPWDADSRRMRERIAFAHALDDAWPDASEDALTVALEDWLGPFLTGMRSAQDLRRLDLVAALRHHVGWQRAAELDAIAPSHIEVPSGSRIAIDYSDPGAPVLAVRLQELFGLDVTPSVGGGSVPLTLHLLSPARRPVQVTRDLPSFWRSAYFEVRKDLKGRYPKHHWPDDPLAAEAVRGVRPRG